MIQTKSPKANATEKCNKTKMLGSQKPSRSENFQTHKKNVKEKLCNQENTQKPKQLQARRGKITPQQKCTRPLGAVLNDERDGQINVTTLIERRIRMDIIPYVFSNTWQQSFRIL